MRQKTALHITFLGTMLALLLAGNISIAQEVEIRLGKKNIALNEYFTISIVVKNGQLKSYSTFPEIPGWDKRGISNQSSTNIVNGHVSREMSLVQNYQARKIGSYTIKPFEIEINGVAVPHDGGTVEVGPAKNIGQNQWDPFEDFFGRRNTQPQEFVEVKDDAFFSITTDKNEVYSGEGFNIQMGFYISERNRAEMQFYDLNGQITQLIQKVKPSNCWEENFDITEIKPEIVKIGNKRYQKFKLYEATFYPLGNKDVEIPSVPFKMIKYKVAKQRSVFGRNHQTDYKTFYSKPRTIKVKPLPPHPLKDQVAVGNYRLMDDIKKDTFETGESFNYSFKIVGEGNIAAIKAPEIKSQKAVQVYPPDEFQNISKSNGFVAGKKEFKYYLIPEEPGNLAFDRIFQWIFFNPKTGVYDTLTPSTNVHVYGESKRDVLILSSDLGSFYDRISSENKTLISTNEHIDYLLWMQMLIFVLAGIGIWKYFQLK